MPARRKRKKRSKPEVHKPQVVVGRHLIDEADVALFHGDLLRVVELDARKARLEAISKGMHAARANATVAARLLLRGTFRLEGWGVRKLSRRMEHACPAVEPNAHARTQ
jgi:hypothetical protein